MIHSSLFCCFFSSASRIQLRIEMFHRILPAIVNVVLEIQRFRLIAHCLADGLVHRLQLVRIVPRNRDGFLVCVENGSYMNASL